MASYLRAELLLLNWLEQNAYNPVPLFAMGDAHVLVKIEQSLTQAEAMRFLIEQKRKDMDS